MTLIRKSDAHHGGAAKSQEPTVEQRATSVYRSTCYNNEFTGNQESQLTTRKSRIQKGRFRTHASLVTTFYSHATRGPGGRRGRQPQVSGPVGLYTAAGRRDLLVPVHGAVVVVENYCL